MPNHLLSVAKTAKLRTVPLAPTTENLSSCSQLWRARRAWLAREREGSPLGGGDSSVELIGGVPAHGAVGAFDDELRDGAVAAEHEVAEHPELLPVADDGMPERGPVAGAAAQVEARVLDERQGGAEANLLRVDRRRRERQEAVRRVAAEHVEPQGAIEAGRHDDVDGTADVDAVEPDRQVQERICGEATHGAVIPDRRGGKTLRGGGGSAPG